METRHLSIIVILIAITLYANIAFALDTPQTCDTLIIPPRWPSSHIYITDTNESLPYIPLTDHTAIFHDDDVWNTSTQPRDVHVTLTIQDQDTKQQVFNQTQILQMQACSGPESVKWRFVPIQVANYIATVSDDRGNVDMSFNSMLNATKSQTVSLPLEQLRFGVDSHNVICRQDLQLMIKSEDGSPACVKPDTAQKLIERGWTKEVIANPIMSNQNSNQTVSVVSIKQVPPVTPGGPTIQLTLKNIGNMPITSLKVTLEVNKNYTFDFKDVTPTTPLVPNNSTSQTQILIGAGFQTDVQHPIIITGTENNTQFTYTENVYIQ